MENLIDELGGNREVAKAVECTPNAVSNWRKRGVPWRVRPLIARLAAERGISLPEDFWGQAA